METQLGRPDQHNDIVLQSPARHLGERRGHRLVALDTIGRTGLLAQGPEREADARARDLDQRSTCARPSAPISSIGMRREPGSGRASSSSSWSKGKPACAKTVTTVANTKVAAASVRKDDRPVRTRPQLRRIASSVCCAQVISSRTARAA
jgi:hypothetical protein